MEYKELINILNRKKRLIILITLVSAVLAFVLRFTSDRTYIAESQISTGLTLGNDFAGETRKINAFEVTVSFGNTIENMTSKLVSNLLSYKILYHELTTENPYRLESSELFKEIVSQEELYNKILDQLLLATSEYYLINKNDLVGKVIYDLLKELSYSEESLVENVSVDRVGETDFITIRFASEIPELSAYIANLWAETFIDYYGFQRKTLLGESLNVLQEILKEKQSLLDQSTQKLNNYKSRYLYRNTDTDSDPITEFERLIREKESKVQSLNYRLQNIRNMIADSDQSSSNNRSRQRIIDLKSDIDRLNNRLLINPNNIQIIDSLEYLRNEYQKQMYLQTSSVSAKNNLDNLFLKENQMKVEYEIELADLQKLRNQYQVEKGMAQDLAANESTLENLEAELEQARQDFVSAQDRYNQSRSELLVGSASLRMSYYSDIPTDAQARQTVLYTIIGLLGGAIVTFVIIVFGDIIDDRIRNKFKYSRATGVEPSSIIPKINHIGDDIQSVLTGSAFKNEEMNSGILKIANDLRYQFLNQSGKKILFTSLREFSGKSFLISLLSNSLGNLNKKILIIDTNFRNPGLTKYLHTTSNESDNKFMVLSESTSSEDFKQVDLICSPTQNKNVDIIRGSVSENTPDEVLSKIDFTRDLLALFENKYDYIFFEGSSLNIYSDSMELARYADKIVCVLSSDHTYKTEDSKSFDFINKSEKSFMNILNLVPIEEMNE